MKCPHIDVNRHNFSIHVEGNGRGRGSYNVRTINGKGMGLKNRRTIAAESRTFKTFFVIYSLCEDVRGDSGNGNRTFLVVVTYRVDQRRQLQSGIHFSSGWRRKRAKIFSGNKKYPEKNILYIGLKYIFCKKTRFYCILNLKGFLL